MAPAGEHTDLEHALTLVNIARDGARTDADVCDSLVAAIDILVVASPFGPSDGSARADVTARAHDARNRAALDSVVDALLDQPAHSLVTYGTLAPGRDNHHVMDGIAGEWSQVTIEGELGDWIGYPMFRWQSGGADIPAWHLRSVDLPAHYDRLDAFETSAYARHLVPYFTRSGIGVANCYVAAERS